MPVTAAQEATKLVVREQGLTGLPGTDGTDGVGIQTVRMSKLNNPLCHLFKTNKLTETLSGALTWTRATTATYVDRYGVVKTASIDEPREESEGFLIEGASTNLLTYSEDFTNAAWTKVNCTVQGNQSAAPDENSSGDRVTISANGDAYVTRVYNRVAGTSYTVSCFFKRQSASDTGLILTNGDTTTFDLSDGALISQGGTHSFSSEEVDNSWFRVMIAVDSPATSGGENTRIGVQSGLSSDIFDLWGAQLEELPFASSYIPTTTAAVTRAADVVSAAAANNTPLLNDDNSIVFSVSTIGSNAINQNVVNVVATDNFSRSIAYWQSDETSLLNYISGTNADIVVGSQLNTNYIASVYSSGSLIGYADGDEKINSPIAYEDDPVGSIVYFGSESGNKQLFGHIKDLRIYDFALNAAEVDFLA